MGGKTHPGGLPPSRKDLNLLAENAKIVGITLGHNGSIYYYTKPNAKIPKADMKVAVNKNKEFEIFERYERALNELQKRFEFEWRKL